MKRKTILVLVVFGVVGIANANLFNNFDGTITEIRDDPTYGDGLILMWLQNASSGNRMDWWEAMAWADQLTYGGYDDWRLPHAYGGIGFNNVSSELGYMYYVSLGNVAVESSVKNTGPFYNVGMSTYWTDTLYSDPSVAWDFSFYSGRQGLSNKSLTNPQINDYQNAWAVRDVGYVPVPSAILLGSLGLTFTGWLLRKRKML